MDAKTWCFFLTVVAVWCTTYIINDVGNVWIDISLINSITIYYRYHYVCYGVKCKNKFKKKKDNNLNKRPRSRGGGAFKKKGRKTGRSPGRRNFIGFTGGTVLWRFPVYCSVLDFDDFDFPHRTKNSMDTHTRRKFYNSPANIPAKLSRSMFNYRHINCVLN